MKNADSHIYLYAKGWYKETDVIEDMKRIVSIRNGIEPEYCSSKDIAHLLLSIAQSYIRIEHDFSNFVMDLSPNSFWAMLFYPEEKDRYDFNKSVIRKCLSVLRTVQVMDVDKVLLELDKPDPEILPLKKVE